jgi:dihydroxyacetone kinase phosphotransfer subunit
LVGIVVVSHSAALAQGVVELAGQMAGKSVRIVAAGGTAEGSLGTDESLVRAAIAEADAGEGVVVLGDLGSAILTIRSILEDANVPATLADAPIAEGAVSGAVLASTGADRGAVAAAAEEARDARKL